MTYFLGVDLGTTYSAAAVHERGTTQIVSLGHRAIVVPSVVFVAPDGVLVGEPAVRRAATDPTRVVREFKRRIGDDVPIVVDDAAYPPEHLMGLLLRDMVARVAEQHGGPPDRTVVTFPANWGLHKKQRLADGIRAADVGPVTIVTEPEAAAISYASTERVSAGECIAVYDLGGGTFDAAILRKTATGFRMLGTPQGIDRLGGIDLDAAIIAHVCEAVDAAGRASVVDAPRWAADRLLAECIAAKEALSADTSATIPVALPHFHADLLLTREELEGMARPLLERTIRSLRRAIDVAGLRTADIDRVLLVGGASRMPVVSEMVGEALARPSFVDAHPKHVVALGAALAASMEDGADAVGTVVAGAPARNEVQAAPPPATRAEHPIPPAPVLVQEPVPEPPVVVQEPVPEPTSLADVPGPPTSVVEEEPMPTDMVVGDPPVLVPPPSDEVEPNDDGDAAGEVEEDDGAGGPEPDAGAPPSPAPTAPTGVAADRGGRRQRDGAGRRGLVAAGAVVAVVAVGVALAVTGGDGEQSGTDAGPADEPTPVTGVVGGELIDVATFPRGVIEPIDPALASTRGGAQVAHALYDTLTELDTDDPDDPRVLPQVAASYDVSDGGSTWSFTIRDGLSFSDGEQVLPSSFVRGWERATASEMATDLTGELFGVVDGANEKLDGTATTISGLRADDDAMTLEVRLDHPDMGFDALVGHHAFAPMPSAVERIEDQTTWQDTIMVGNGPFVLEAPPTSDRITLVPNPEWDGTRYDAGLRLPEQPFLDRVSVVVPTGGQDALEALAAGDAQVANLISAPQADAPDGYEGTFDLPAHTSFHLQIGWDHPVVGGPENRLLRRAISRAIDREAATAELFGDNGEPADGITPPAIPGARSGACDHCTFDPEAARADLAEWESHGNRLTAPLRIQSSATTTNPAVGVVVDNLAAVGIEAVEVPLGAEYRSRLAAEGCELCVAATFADYPSQESFVADGFHSSVSPLRNTGGFADEMFDRLVAQAQAVSDPEARAEAYRAAEQRLLSDDVAAIPLSWYQHPYVYTDEIASLPVNNLGRVVWEAVSFEER